MSSSPIVTLRDGSEVPQPVLFSTIWSLREAMKVNSLAFHDLVQKCKDPNYRFESSPFGNSKPILQQFALIDKDERIHDVVKTIILNSVQGEGLLIRFIHPAKL